MTLTFHLYFDGIEVAEPEIYRSELARYKKDSQRSLKGYWRRKCRHIKTMFNTITFWSPLLAVTLLAFGLHDKNGKEIDERRFEIGFVAGSFILVDPQDRSGERGGFSAIYLHTPALQVIGNIYENPELLTNK